MTENKAKLILATLAWMSKHYRVPQEIIDQGEEVLSSSGHISNSEIKLKTSQFQVTVKRHEKFGVLGDPNAQTCHAMVSGGSRIQCNLNGEQIVGGVVLNELPNGEITVSVGSDTASANYYGSTSTFSYK